MDAEERFEAASLEVYSLSQNFQRREEVEQVKAMASRNCGHCNKWMTRSCPLEGQQRGYPHMNVPACEQFDPKQSQIEATKKLKELTKPNRVHWTLTHFAQIMKLSRKMTKEEMKEAFDMILAMGDQKTARDMACVMKRVEEIRLGVLNLED